MSAKLLLKQNVFQAYLQPLLAKHEGKKTITYEDLTASWQASMAALAQGKESPQFKEFASSVVRLSFCSCLALIESLSMI